MGVHSMSITGLPEVTMAASANFSAVVRDATEPSVQSAPELTVVVPTYNERENVPLIVKRLRHALAGWDWEVIFVDDDSPDGTAAVVRMIGDEDRRVGCIRRIGRRGLAGACIEGMLASKAQYIAVLDADLQHDEMLLAAMLNRLRTSEVDLVVATRYDVNGSAGGLSKTRKHISRWSNALAQRLLGVALTDPMSGFFMIRREVSEELAPRLSTQGFKILLDIATSARGQLRIAELPYSFRSRLHGESKLDARVGLDFVILLVAKLTHDRVSYRFLLFCLVGLTGLFVHMLTLQIAIQAGSLRFISAQSIATFVAITWNYSINNAMTYRDKRLSGWHFWTGLLGFQLICGIGAISNLGISSLIYSNDSKWWLAGVLGALIGTAWNYLVSAAFIWRI